MVLRLTLLFVLLAVSAFAQDATCGPDAAALATSLRADYAGRDLLLDPDRAAGVDRLLAQAPFAASEAACDSLLHATTALFPDGHLRVDTRTPSMHVRDGDRRFAPWSGELEIRTLGTEATVLRIRSFDIGNKAAIDSLVAAHTDRLRSTPYLIIDVTSNGGGGDGAFSSLVPYLYTDPIRPAGMELVASPGNRDDIAAYMVDERIDLETRDYLHALVDRMDAATPGAFIPMGENGEFDTVLDSVTAFPRAVAVLTDAGTASSAEEFVLMARWSSKVVVVGGATEGALDYSNVRSMPLPGGVRVAHLPMTRRAWLPEMSVDAGGIAPDVLVPAGVPDWAVFALGVLVARDEAPSAVAAR